MDDPTGHGATRLKALGLYFGLVAAALIFLGCGGWTIPLGLAIFLPEMPRGLTLTLCYGPHGLFVLLFAAFRGRPVFCLAAVAYAFFLLVDLAGCARELAGLSHLN